MSSFTITISPDGDEAVSTVTTVTVDDSGGVPRITAVLVEAAPGSGISGEQLRSLDLELLLRALSAGNGHARDNGKPADADPIALDVAAPERPAPPADEPAARTTTRTAGGLDTSPPRITAKSRAYRKVPHDLAEVYQRSGSVTEVARHYGVPRYTAQGWIGRLRR